MTMTTSNHRRCGLKAAAALTLLAVCGLAAGCASQNNLPPAAQPAASGTTAALTPEQEAAKQRAIQSGRAMQAAQDAAAKHVSGGQ